MQFSDNAADPLLRLTLQHHRGCASRWGYDYHLLTKRTAPQRHPVWEKVRCIQSVSKDYENVIWLDTDAIWLGEESLELEVEQFGAVLHQGPPKHLNIGVLYCRGGTELAEFCDVWWRQSAHRHPWREQHAFNLLVGAGVASCLSIDCRYNSNFDRRAHQSLAPVVVAWHGMDDRERLMREYLESRG